MSIKRQYLKSKNICKVTFKFPKEMAESASTVHLVGDFNNWDVNASPMKKLKDGSFTANIDLERGREYQFRYFIDQESWQNDSEADKYTPSAYGDAENSVIVIA